MSPLSTTLELSKARLAMRVIVLWLCMALILAVLPSAALAAAPAPASAGDVRILPDDSGVTLELTLPEYQLLPVERDGATYYQVEVAGEGWSQAGLPGAPQTPERGLLLAVPPSGAVTLQVLEAATEEIAGRFVLQPAPAAAAPVDLDRGEERLQVSWQADPAAYAVDAWQPAAQAELGQEGRLRGMRFVRVALHPFQYNAASASLRVAPTLRVRLAFSQPAAAVGRPWLADPHYEPVLRAVFPNYEQASQWRVRPEPAPLAVPANDCIDAAERCVKITANADALYKVTYSDLLNAGIPAATLNGLNPQTLRLLDNNLEQHIYVEGEGDGVFNLSDYLLFYGQRNTAYLSDDNNVYWLTWGGAAGQRMATQNGSPGAASFAADLRTAAQVEQNLVWDEHVPAAEEFLVQVNHDQWYWKKVGTTSDSALTATLPDLKVDTASAFNPVLTAFVGPDLPQGGSFNVEVRANDQPVGNLTWTGWEFTSKTLNLPTGNLVEGDNTVRLVGLGRSFYVDWLRLEYPYNSKFISGAQFYNATAGLWRFQITGVPGSTPWILNLSNPAQPKRVLNYTATSNAGAFDITWQLNTASSDKFLVAPPNDVRSAVAIQRFVNTGLLDAGPQADYLAISHADFMTAIQPLIDAHAADGLAARVVDVQAIYDHFSDGSLRVQAIHDYLAYAYTDYLPPAPAYVLLVGDGTIDFRGYNLSTGGQRNWIPPFPAYDKTGNFTTVFDSLFTLLDGDDVLSEMMLGRLNVNSVAETQLVVNKILNYQPANPTPSWEQQTLWVADDPDAGGDFHQLSESTVAYLLPEFQAQRIYYCPTGHPTCTPGPYTYSDALVARQTIIDAISQGRLLINYTGHGGYGVWGGTAPYTQFLFGNSVVPQLSNGSKLGFVVISACATDYFARSKLHGLGENMLRHSNGGVIGSFAPTTFDYASSQTVLLNHFYHALMHERLTRVGVAAAVTKARAYADLPTPLDGYTAVGHMLTGDPALVLLHPTDNCAVGDVDCDGDIDIVDIQIAAGGWNTRLGSVGYHPRADLDDNHVINVADISGVADRWGTLP